MCRYIGPKNRIARRFGANIFGKSRNPLLRKAHPPGMHGARRKKKSDFGLQLEEKQKLKACYGMILDRQFVLMFKRAAQQKGNTTQLFAQALECRLDTLVYRLGFARTIFGAQQLVSHGHILVDGKKVDIRSFQVQPGMVISVKESSQKLRVITDALASFGGNIPSYLSIEKGSTRGQLLTRPLQEEIEQRWPMPVNIGTVCEFLAHTS